MDAKKPIAKNLLDAGCFVDSTKGQAYLDAYLAKPGCQKKEDPTHIYGHVFGLNKLKQLIEKIEKFNGAQVNVTDHIYGVRIYNAVSTRSDMDFPTVGMLDDLIIVPVDCNGDDVHQTTAKALDSSISMVLAESRPCPNQCA